MAEHRIRALPSWEGEVAVSSLDPKTKQVLLHLALRFSRMGSVILSERSLDDWVADLAGETGLTPNRVIARLDDAHRKGWLDFIRHKDDTGRFTVREMSPVVPHFAGAPTVGQSTPNRTAFQVRGDKDHFLKDVMDALRTDRTERGLPITKLEQELEDGEPQ